MPSLVSAIANLETRPEERGVTFLSKLIELEQKCGGIYGKLTGIFNSTTHYKDRDVAIINGVRRLFKECYSSRPIPIILRYAHEPNNDPINVQGASVGAIPERPDTDFKPTCELPLAYSMPGETLIAAPGKIARLCNEAIIAIQGYLNVLNKQSDTFTNNHTSLTHYGHHNDAIRVLSVLLMDAFLALSSMDFGRPDCLEKANTHITFLSKVIHDNTIVENLIITSPIDFQSRKYAPLMIFTEARKTLMEIEKEIANKQSEFSIADHFRALVAEVQSLINCEYMFTVYIMAQEIITQSQLVISSQQNVPARTVLEELRQHLSAYLDGDTNTPAITNYGENATLSEQYFDFDAENNSWRGKSKLCQNKSRSGVFERFWEEECITQFIELCVYLKTIGRLHSGIIYLLKQLGVGGDLLAIARMTESIEFILTALPDLMKIMDLNRTSLETFAADQFSSICGKEPSRISQNETNWRKNYSELFNLDLANSIKRKQEFIHALINKIKFRLHQPPAERVEEFREDARRYRLLLSEVASTMDKANPGYSLKPNFAKFLPQQRVYEPGERDNGRALAIQANPNLRIHNAASMPATNNINSIIKLLQSYRNGNGYVNGEPTKFTKKDESHQRKASWLHFVIQKLQSSLPEHDKLIQLKQDIKKLTEQSDYQQTFAHSAKNPKGTEFHQLICKIREKLPSTDLQNTRHLTAGPTAFSQPAVQKDAITPQPVIRRAAVAQQAVEETGEEPPAPPQSVVRRIADAQQAVEETGEKPPAPPLLVVREAADTQQEFEETEEAPPTLPYPVVTELEYVDDAFVLHDQMLEPNDAASALKNPKYQAYPAGISHHTITGSPSTSTAPAHLRGTPVTTPLIQDLKKIVNYLLNHPAEQKEFSPFWTQLCYLNAEVTFWEYIFRKNPEYKKMTQCHAETFTEQRRIEKKLDYYLRLQIALETGTPGQLAWARAVLNSNSNPTDTVQESPLSLLTKVKNIIMALNSELTQAKTARKIAILTLTDQTKTPTIWPKATEDGLKNQWGNFARKMGIVTSTDLFLENIAKRLLKLDETPTEEEDQYKQLLLSTINNFSKENENPVFFKEMLQGLLMLGACPMEWIDKQLSKKMQPGKEAILTTAIMAQLTEMTLAYLCMRSLYLGESSIISPKQIQALVTATNSFGIALHSTFKDSISMRKFGDILLGWIFTTKFVEDGIKQERREERTQLYWAAVKLIHVVLNGVLMRLGSVTKNLVNSEELESVQENVENFRKACVDCKKKGWLINNGETELGILSKAIDDILKILPNLGTVRALQTSLETLNQTNAEHSTANQQNEQKFATLLKANTEAILRLIQRVIEKKLKPKLNGENVTREDLDAKENKALILEAVRVIFEEVNENDLDDYLMEYKKRHLTAIRTTLTVSLAQNSLTHFAKNSANETTQMATSIPIVSHVVGA
jgi:hypothetical protein